MTTNPADNAVATLDHLRAREAQLEADRRAAIIALELVRDTIAMLTGQRPAKRRQAWPVVVTGETPPPDSAA